MRSSRPIGRVCGGCASVKMRLDSLDKEEFLSNLSTCKEVVEMRSRALLLTRMSEALRRASRLLEVSGERLTPV